MESVPKIFISYSHDNDDHKDWVYRLACNLVENGIDVILDQWDLNLGSNLPKFMEQSLHNSERVLVICTDDYIHKADEGLGGVGYEKTIITAELIQQQNTTKFIPVVRNVTKMLKTPLCLGGRVYADFGDESDYNESLDLLFREIHGVPKKPKPMLGINPFKSVGEEEGEPVLGEISTTFFHRRFCSAFPGIRGVAWFNDPSEAIIRLNKLLEQPLVFTDGRPIWWWRDGDLQIEDFKQIDDSTVLMDGQEFIIDKVAAVNAGSYYQSFVYLQTKKSEPTGLYNDFSMEEWIREYGYYREEYGIYEEHLITRAEYDDNAAVINGEVVDLKGQAEIRVRYLTPYNLIIAPIDSPINNKDYDLRRVELMNAILREEEAFESLVKEIMLLPKKSRY